jgi:NADH:ubiquinone oxidoreductase subunit 4 (subunit M)
MGILEACFRLLGQRDLKRIVALTTVIELNWIGLALASGGYMLELLAVFLMVAHSFTTAAEFFFVEALYKRYHTRDLTRITGLAVTYPQI